MQSSFSHVSCQHSSLCFLLVYVSSLMTQTQYRRLLIKFPTPPIIPRIQSPSTVHICSSFPRIPHSLPLSSLVTLSHHSSFILYPPLHPIFSLSLSTSLLFLILWLSLSLHIFTSSLSFLPPLLPSLSAVPLSSASSIPLPFFLLLSFVHSPGSLACLRSWATMIWRPFRTSRLESTSSLTRAPRTDMKTYRTWPNSLSKVCCSFNQSEGHSVLYTISSLSEMKYK